MIDKTYQKHLLAEHLNKIAGEAGVHVASITFHDTATSVYADVELMVRLSGTSWKPEHNEEAARRILAAMPDTVPANSSELLYLRGKTNLGFTFKWYFGSGNILNVTQSEAVAA